MPNNGTIAWKEGEQIHLAQWHSENSIPPHKRVVLVDDTLTADTAYRYACEGTAMLWKSDFQNARQLLQALATRIDKPSKNIKRDKEKSKSESRSILDNFNHHRLAQSQRARILGMLLIPLNADHSISLRRAPDVSQACLEAYGLANESYVISLRELLGVISAHEWRKRGVPILVNQDQKILIYPHYGVFSPIRGEYIELICKAPLPKAVSAHSIAFDIGAGTGVLSILLAMRGIKQVTATDQDVRALACATENIERLSLTSQITVVKENLFPVGQAALIVCNPPWLPARPSSSLEHAVYDPESQMLKGFLSNLKAHLLPQGEGWLILSDLAEHLELRTRQDLLTWIEDSGLLVVGRLDTKPVHKKIFDKADSLHFARAAEVTSLWRLRKNDV
jgi:2-polyprenyl-3-methyl-5-hydroxy-6-metoxy-1,4-benzoquinol methylase